ncbi:MAG: hypothetical protein ACRC2V_24830, partial [Xenococcaceae cyanobacterium]
MRSFWYEYLGDRVEVIFSLIENGRWWYHNTSGEKLGIKFDYPYPENDNELEIGMDDLEELDQEVRAMLFQKLKLDAPEFGL